MSSSVKNASGNVVTTLQAYDANNQLTAQYWQLGSTQYSETYTYSKTTGLLATHKPAVGNMLSYGYDTLQRLSTVNGGIYGKTYTYRNTTGNNTTTQVSQLKYSLPTEIIYGYTYDDLGNIAEYSENGTEYTYVYDAQNQLTDVLVDDVLSYEYSYDAAGNIQEVTDATGTHTYTYATGVWKDLLTAYDGKAIAYDGSGNPTSYYNGARWTMTWAEGRRLATASKSGTSLSFTYDSDGLRLSKTVNNSTTYNYYYAGGKLLRQTGGGNTLDFFYDASGNPYALKYNNTLYYYITNLQGDVLHIVNTSGTPVVSYSYDPYGKPTTVEPDTTNDALAAANPLRYRGYVYDAETGLYYLQSRYYDPTTGRFINADGYASTGQGIIGCNMFAYCLNNPVNLVDEGGNNAASATLPSWIIGLLPAIDGPVPIGDAIVIIILLEKVIAAINAISEQKESKILSQDIAKVRLRDDKAGAYTVYFLCAEGDSTRKIVYVGRVKTANFNARMNYHSSKGRELVGYVCGLTYDECRILEQLAMSHFHSVVRGDSIHNQIRGVSIGKMGKFYDVAMHLVMSGMYPEDGTFPLSYLLNQVENEYLNSGR